MAAPFLSLVVTGRNDDFGGDFTGRFFRAVDFNHRQLVKAGVDVEIVFVEWCPLPDRPWLATLLADAFPALAGRRLFSYVVDAPYHAALSLNPRLAFQEFLAKNVGIRRARAPFVLSTNSDVYLGREIVEVLRRQALAPRTLYRATRIDVSPSVDPGRSEDGAFLEDERHHLMTYPSKGPLFTAGSGDFQLMDAEGFATVRGFNEVYRLARIHIDGNFCFKVQSMGLPIVHLGAPIYHVGHGTVVSQNDQFAARPETAPWGDRRWHKRVVYENPEGWGLRDARAQQVSADTTLLEFSWQAVPPLVALRRLVLPAFRRPEAPAAGGPLTAEGRPLC